MTDTVAGQWGDQRTTPMRGSMGQQGNLGERMKDRTNSTSCATKARGRPRSAQPTRGALGPCYHQAWEGMALCCREKYEHAVLAGRLLIP